MSKLKTDTGRKTSVEVPANGSLFGVRAAQLPPPKLELTSNARRVLEKRYLRKGADGKLVETPEDMFRRVAHNIAQAERFFNGETDMGQWEERFYEAMMALEFVPNSPTLMNAGRDLQQLSACFVLPVEDSIDSIFETVKNAALIHKSGGGTGFSFSRLRPRNDAVSTSHGLSSGPVSFMKVFNEATEAINQGGFRRGANMAMLRVDHPDVEFFIGSKQEETQLNNFNISVSADDEFMRRVEADEEYDLLNPRTKKPVKKLSAKKVFDQIVKMAWKSGEPGMVFIDRINRDNPTPKLGNIESTNPCGEQPLLPFESCNLGSVNLSKMVKGGKVDYDKLGKTVRLAVRFLDNVIEMNHYPLPQIDHVTKSNRKIGLGVMGFADMLIHMAIPYDSEDALALAEDVMKFVDEESKDASRFLAKERGPFPNFKESAFNDRGEPYIRNATTTTIAPTGTISIIAGTSSGIEPVFALCYTRNVLDNEKLFEAHPTFETVARREGFLSDELMKEVAQKGRVRGVESVPELWQKVFVTAHEVSPEWHVKMQAAFQKYTDNAVSKTVNFCNDASPEEVAKVFFAAYHSGCKGITVFRDGCREKQVLETGDHKTDSKKQHGALQVGETLFTPVPRSRPDVVTGTTRKLRTGCGNLYVTINCDDEGMPFELFCSMGKAGGCAASQSESIARLISFAFRSGANITEITKHLKGICCHRVGWEKTGKILSCADGVAKALELFVQEGGRRPAAMAFSTGASSAAGNEAVNPSENGHAPEKSADGSSTWVTDISALSRGACPECGGIVEHDSGCVVCRACGFSECG